MTLYQIWQNEYFRNVSMSLLQYVTQIPIETIILSINRVNRLALEDSTCSGNKQRSSLAPSVIKKIILERGETYAVAFMTALSTPHEMHNELGGMVRLLSRTCEATYAGTLGSSGRTPAPEPPGLSERAHKKLTTL